MSNWTQLHKVITDVKLNKLNTNWLLSKTKHKLISDVKLKLITAHTSHITIPCCWTLTQFDINNLNINHRNVEHSWTLTLSKSILNIKPRNTPLTTIQFLEYEHFIDMLFTKSYKTCFSPHTLSKSICRSQNHITCWSKCWLLSVDTWLILLSSRRPWI
jgi:hypothetical protein